ncbi:hypothetical protein P9112_013825 [Eukaryota sp. TZLM1-RC]
MTHQNSRRQPPRGHSPPLSRPRTNSLDPFHSPDCSPVLCSTTDFCPHQQYPNSMVGVRCILSSQSHTLLLTFAGDVYCWGLNDRGTVLSNGFKATKSPIKLPPNDIISISTGDGHFLALSSYGKLYGWGRNDLNQINTSEEWSLPITPINIPYNIKEVYGSHGHSYALTQGGEVIKWGNGKSFELIEELNNIVFLFLDHEAFVAMDGNGDFFCSKILSCGSYEIDQLDVFQCFIPREPLESSFLFIDDFLFIVDTNGDVWKFDKGRDDVPFNNKPTKVPGLTNIVSISGYDGIYAAIDNNGKVYLWGWLSRMSDVYEDSEEPRCIEAFTNIEGISVGHDFLFAYNKNTVWAWGRNDKGQLGTGDLIDRPQPVKVFGSEILGNFQYPKQPLDRMFSGLIKLVYWEYLQFLKNLFGNHPYVKARYYTKCSISKRVAEFAKEVFNGFKLLKDPQDLDLNENICDLKLRLSTDYKGPKVINTRIKKLDVYFDKVDYDPQLLSLFPNVEVVKLGGSWSFATKFSINLAHSSKLKCLELGLPSIVEQLPTSLVKLVLQQDIQCITDLCYPTFLRELVVSNDGISSKILRGQIPLPQSIVRFEVFLTLRANVKIHLPNLKELIIHGNVPTNITEQNFPALKFIQLNRPNKDNLAKTLLSPKKLNNQRLIKSVKLIKNEYLVELSCFPRWIQYPVDSYLTNCIYSSSVFKQSKKLQKKRKCSLCGSVGHDKRTCPSRS